AARRRDQPLQPVTPHREGLSPCSDGARRAGGAGPRGGLRRVRQALAARRPSAQGQLKEYTRPNTAAVRRFNGRSGIEFPTAVGPIDILAIDASGDFFVFELKRARSPDHSIGQPTRYMGWVQQTIGKGSKSQGNHRSRRNWREPTLRRINRPERQLV